MQYDRAMMDGDVALLGVAVVSGFVVLAACSVAGMLDEIPSHNKTPTIAPPAKIRIVMRGLSRALKILIIVAKK